MRQKLWTINEIFDRSIPEPNTGCWLWLGALSRDGYPHTDGEFSRVHRAAWSCANGYRLPDELQAHHICRQKSCVNPAHVLPVTPAEHYQLELDTRYRKPLNEVCKRGHAMIGDNILMEPWINGKPIRRCRTCRRMMRERRRLLREGESAHA